jgi:cytochrome c
MWGRLASAAAVAALLCSGHARADDVQDGQAAFNRICMVCHTVEAGKSKLGPSLFGVVGRKSGSEPGFNYSEAMKGAGLTWDEDTLDKYLNDPKAVVPGNKMTYAGVKKADDRKAIIAYLKTLH